MASPQQILTARLSGPLRGSAFMPCGPLEAHLALVLAAVSVGRSTISGIDLSPDVAAMIAALRVFGCRIAMKDNGDCLVDGVGVGGLAEPDCVIELAQVGLGGPLLIALAALQPMTTMFTAWKGADAVSSPRLTAALEQFGASFLGRPHDRRPFTVLGAANPVPTEFIAHSPQERAALLVAALNCPGESVVHHGFAEQERLDSIFAAFGVRLSVLSGPNGARQTLVEGQVETRAATLCLAFDAPTASLVAATACSRADCDIVLQGLGVDFRFAETLKALRVLGADWSLEPVNTDGQGVVHDCHLRASRLAGAVLKSDAGPGPIDDFPLLAAVAARATGTTVIGDWAGQAAWLQPLVRGLAGCGVDAHVEGTSLVVKGNGGALIPGGYRVEAGLDHRIAAAFLLIGLSSEAPVALEGGAALLDHYPGFFRLLTRFGGTLTVEYL